MFTNSRVCDKKPVALTYTHTLTMHFVALGGVEWHFSAFSHVNNLYGYSRQSEKRACMCE